MHRAATSQPSATATIAPSARKRLNVFERYLSLWVGLCMVVGVGAWPDHARDDAQAAKP